MQHDKPTAPRSLLRRLLQQAEKAFHPGEAVPAAPATMAPTTAVSTPLNAAPDSTPVASSPIRPPPPAPAPIPEAIEPQSPALQPIIPRQIASAADRMQAETALLHLREKTAGVTNEFAEGKINRAQFLSLYGHYHEKIVIIERMLTKDPNTQAWQSVARPGHTTFLKAHFEARMLAFAVYDYGSPAPITVQGSAPLPDEAITHLLQALRTVRHNRADLKPVSRKVKNEQFVLVVPGKYTVAVALFSLEPAAFQIKNARDLHLDFERANRHALERNIRQPEQLVFPHRALLSERPEA